MMKHVKAIVKAAPVDARRLIPALADDKDDDNHGLPYWLPGIHPSKN